MTIPAQIYNPDSPQERCHMAGHFIPPIPTPSVPYGEQSVQRYGSQVSSLQLDGHLHKGLSSALFALWCMVVNQSGESAKPWRVLEMESGRWRDVWIQEVDDVHSVLADFDFIGAVASFKEAEFSIQAVRTVDSIQGIRMNTRFIVPSHQAMCLGERLHQFAQRSVSDRAVVCGYVNVGDWSNPLVEFDPLRAQPQTWFETAKWAPGYVWVVFLAPEAAARAQLTTGKFQGLVTVTELPGGSWKVAAVSPEHPEHDRALLLMREMLWPALPIVAPVLGSQTPARMWEGGPIGVAARYIDDPGLDPATTIVSMVEGEKMHLEVMTEDEPDEGTLTDIRWTIDAWRRFGYAFRADTHIKTEFVDWLVPKVEIEGNRISVDVPKTDPAWAAMLHGILNERRCVELRNGSTKILEIRTRTAKKSRSQR